MRAGVITSLSVVLFSSYGHVYNVLHGKSLFGFPIGQANYIAAAWASLWIVLSWLAWRKLTDPAGINRILNVISILLVCMPLASLGIFWGKTAAASGIDPAAGPPAAGLSGAGRLPDIYYIILDEYGRSDMLDQTLGYDNAAFLEDLRGLGFTVADKSYANYGITLHSMSSSLNFRYLNDSVTSKPEDEPANTHLLLEMIHHNRAREILEENGYTFVTFATGYPFSEIQDADEYLAPENYLNGIEMEYIKGSALAIFSDAINAQRERALILNAFNRLSAMPEFEPGTPKFILAHIQSNHVPFVFGPNGEAVAPWAWPAGADQGQAKSYAQAYSDQAAYMNRLILATVSAILKTSPVEPIIVLQGDHGTEQYLDWYSLENTCVKERMSILNAYYFPGGDTGALYPSITPVNTFRLIFDRYLGTNFGLVEDRVYFSLWDTSYAYIDVTGQMKDCAPR